jgi:hypothetical protein
VSSQPELSLAGPDDPQPQRGKYGPPGLVWFYARCDTWEKAESAPTVTWVFPDGRASLSSSP